MISRCLPNGEKNWVCTVDMLSGYHQIPLDKESRDLTTFITLYGKFRFCRQSMGMRQEGDKFNQETDLAIEEVIQDEEMMKFTLIYKSVDDVIICCHTKEQMDAAADKFLGIFKRQGIKISLKKFQLSTRVVYGGVEIDISRKT